MENNKKTNIVKDAANKRLTVSREFDAPKKLVWKAWTEAELLDEWWAPKPWKTETKSLDFRKGGNWLYAMVGPDGTKHWCQVEFTAVRENESFESAASFCDENGIKNEGFPTMFWKNIFRSVGEQTIVDVEIRFDKEADMEQIIAMGFEAGFTMGLGNLDVLLESLVVSDN